MYNILGYVSWNVPNSYTTDHLIIYVFSWSTYTFVLQ